LVFRETLYATSTLFIKPGTGRNDLFLKIAKITWVRNGPARLIIQAGLPDLSFTTIVRRACPTYHSQQSSGGPARLIIHNIFRRACPTYYSQQSAGGPARLIIHNNLQAGLPDLLFTTILRRACPTCFP